MSQNHSNDFNPFDPTGLMKSMRDSGMESWSRSMLQLVNSDAYAQATAVMLDAWLAQSAPFRKAIDAAMAQALASLNMPTRADVINLATRLTNIEMRLDDLEAMVERLQPSGRRTGRSAARSATGEEQK
jgi:hypothetical protein